MAHNFDKGEKLGEGTWGVVTLGIEKSTGRKVALKKIGMSKFKDGVNFTALREVKLLRELKHENIIELVEVFTGHDHITLVFEYCCTDMEAIIMDQSIMLSASHIKCHMRMLLEGLQHCHANWVIHRDLKPNNCLYSDNGVLKLADFGLARAYGSPSRMMSPQMCTLWYRPPELCFGCREYGDKVDMWGVGCMLAELMLRRPLFQGYMTEIDQLAKTFQIMGTPNFTTTDSRNVWKDVASLPAFVEFTPQAPVDLRTIITAASQDAMDLIEKLLVLDPSKRLSAKEALEHEYFKASPAPVTPDQLSMSIPEQRRLKHPANASPAA